MRSPFPSPLTRSATILVLLLVCSSAAVSRRARAQTDPLKSDSDVPSSSSPHLTLPVSEETRADCLVARHQYVEAIGVYEAIPNQSAPLLNKLGIAYEKMRLYPQARLNFERSLAINPKFSGPENNLGTVFYALGDYHRAEQHYKRALKIDPRNASIYNNLGTLYFMRRKIHRGMEAYQQAQSLDPDIFQRAAENRIETEGSRETRAIINFYLAETCAQAGRNEAALTYLRRAIDAGFNDGNKLRQDGHFAVLRETPEFKELMLSALPPHPAV